jgi:hypothetical protein
MAVSKRTLVFPQTIVHGPWQTDGRTLQPAAIAIQTTELPIIFIFKALVHFHHFQ